MSTAIPEVAVIVLNWNGKDDTLSCLKSVRAQSNVIVHTVLVDNASSDQSVAAVRESFPEVEVIESGANLGYAGGNNVGLEHALQRGFDYIFVLNNDTVLDPTCLAKLVADLKAHPNAAAAGPKALFMDSPTTIHFGGGVLTQRGVADHLGMGQQDGPQFFSGDSDWLTGCAILFRSRALKEIGLFESKFFLLFEDLDWSMRARKLGYKLRFAADARLWHKGSASFGKPFSPSYWYYYSRNNLLWIERTFSRRQRPRLYFSALKRSLYAVLLDRKMSMLERMQICRSITQGIGDYLFRRFDERNSSR
jgi:GT2 family glycosyltransferase